MKKKKYSLVFISLIVILLILIVLTLCVGKYEVSPLECLSILFNLDRHSSEMTINVIWGLRLPRILGAIIVGAALSVSGSAYQGIYRNPLISPDFLGVSSGACIGAAIAILLSLPSYLVSIFAFVGGIIAVIITSLIPTLIKNRSNIMLILSGIIVSSLMSSILGLLKFIADPESELASIVYWTMGSFSYISLKEILPILLISIPSIIILILLSWWIDVVSIGESEAKSLGANTRLIKTIVIVCATLLTSGSVCLAGTIGWVGLIIPHFSRMLVGSSNKKIIPISALLGAIFMLLVDTLTRTIGIIEMPVSIMTGIIGAPFFIWLLIKRKDSIS